AESVMFVSTIAWAGSRHRRVIGREERTPGLFVVGFLEWMVLADIARACSRRPCIDRLEETLEVRMRAKRIPGALAYPRGPIKPAPGRHVGNRVRVADDMGTPFEMLVEHLVMTLRLAPVAVHRIVEAFRRGELEVDGLARERPKPGGQEQQ